MYLLKTRTTISEWIQHAFNANTLQNEPYFPMIKKNLHKGKFKVFKEWIKTEFN